MVNFYSSVGDIVFTKQTPVAEVSPKKATPQPKQSEPEIKKAVPVADVTINKMPLIEANKIEDSTSKKVLSFAEIVPKKEAKPNQQANLVGSVQAKTFKTDPNENLVKDFSMAMVNPIVLLERCKRKFLF